MWNYEKTTAVIKHNLHEWCLECPLFEKICHNVTKTWMPIGNWFFSNCCF
jgi:hypothetical protein